MNVRAITHYNQEDEEGITNLILISKVITA